MTVRIWRDYQDEESSTFVQDGHPVIVVLLDGIFAVARGAGMHEGRDDGSERHSS